MKKMSELDIVFEGDNPNNLPKIFDPDFFARVSASRMCFKITCYILGNYNLKNETVTYVQNKIYSFHTMIKNINEISYVLYHKYGITLNLISKYAHIYRK
jgi:hypothetical protein